MAVLRTTAKSFSASQTPVGSTVDDVPVVGFFNNPVIIVALLEGIIGLLKTWVQQSFFTHYLGDLWGFIISDVIIWIVAPVLVIILEINRKHLTSVKG